MEATHFKNRAKVLEYLKAQGWKIATGTLQLHSTQGKLRPEPGTGEYNRAAVDRYAKTFLRRKETGKKVSAAVEELQRRKAKLEVDKLEEELERIRRKREIDDGKWLPRDQVELELAGRAAILDAGLTHLVLSRAGDWIELVGGDERKISDLITRMIADKDALMNEYAKNKEYIVEIERREPSVEDDEDEAASP